MKKYLPLFVFLASLGLYCITIETASLGSKLYAFSHSLDIHGDEEGIKKEIQRKMEQAARDAASERREKEQREDAARRAKEREESIKKARDAMEDSRKLEQEKREEEKKKKK